MINKFRLKQIPTIEACQWNGENRQEIEEFIGTSGHVQGRYVMLGALDRYGKPTIQNISVGNYVVRTDSGKLCGMVSTELFELYVLED
ncbi:hypothetical protein YOLOSWAG_21 [Erwinia phage vB_EamM_Yoloswag]|uniref:Uncharacterized protein n=1 Tax=Erwinia phage vB_EamM_Yoloswag TaxID=1958956 RepID=A0A1S6L2V6_9CAUD|nr:hypothetical protein HOR66_gp021 [Erwinia phage vB_EamM_Yoloswag]AQT28508.1 hypothetical protein YOLOSWAG_21 [Erwinia phage vB_EamM_Yoloswag]